MDIAIRYRDKVRGENGATNVLVSDMVVIGAVSLLGDRQITNPASLVEMPWLQELGTNEVAQWFRRRGVTIDRPLIISQMPGNLIMQALRRGAGLSYTARAFFREDIETGQMRVLHSEPAAGFYQIETHHGHTRPAVRKFLSFLNSKSETVTA